MDLVRHLVRQLSRDPSSETVVLPCNMECKILVILRMSSLVIPPNRSTKSTKLLSAQNSSQGRYERKRLSDTFGAYPNISHGFQYFGQHSASGCRYPAVAKRSIICCTLTKDRQVRERSSRSEMEARSSSARLGACGHFHACLFQLGLGCATDTCSFTGNRSPQSPHQSASSGRC